MRLTVVKDKKRSSVPLVHCFYCCCLSATVLTACTSVSSPLVLVWCLSYSKHLLYFFPLLLYCRCTSYRCMPSVSSLGGWVLNFGEGTRTGVQSESFLHFDAGCRDAGRALRTLPSAKTFAAPCLQWRRPLEEVSAAYNYSE